MKIRVGNWINIFFWIFWIFFSSVTTGSKAHMLNFVSIIPYCPILSLEAWFVCVFFFLLIFSKTCVVCVFFFCEKKCRDIIMICGKSNWKLDLPLLIGKILFFQFLESTLMGGRDQKIKRFLLFVCFSWSNYRYPLVCPVPPFMWLLLRCVSPASSFC